MEVVFSERRAVDQAEHCHEVRSGPRSLLEGGKQFFYLVAYLIVSWSPAS